MKLHQLTNRIWYTEHDSATDRPTLGYIMGDRRSVMLDAGNSGAHAELFLGLSAEPDCQDRNWSAFPILIGITPLVWHLWGCLPSLQKKPMPCCCKWHAGDGQKEKWQNGWKQERNPPFAILTSDWNILI